MDSSPSPTTPKLNDKFYFADDPMAIFLVEDQLFKVHRHFLVQDSEVFRDLFSVPQGDGAEIEGMTNERPIHLPGVTAKAFTILLEEFYTLPSAPSYFGPWETERSVESVESVEERQAREERQRKEFKDRLSLLEIADRLGFNRILKVTLGNMYARDIPNPTRIRLGTKYDLGYWLFLSYEELLKREESLSVDEAEALGFDRIISFIKAREFMLQERLEHAGAPLNANNTPTSIETVVNKFFTMKPW
ncbi:hypothetical protein NP233_g8722 [Leucocoprinus birnbaumii]|uniref:BTB domain-containing protein n=1 Tax=Leucocoprinus birnbaumii TaxID=56174 RepID=A0AAD5VME0_9AGAR|nr:hypothetical protein NP233_g8722 [Leucocoprinus birnbaumii]